MRSHRRAAAAAAAILVAGGTAAASASAASWRAPAYPATTGNAAVSQAPGLQPTAIAASSSGAATILYRATDRSLRAVSRTSATGAFGAPTTWLAGSKANAGAQLAGAMAGSKVVAVWSQRTPTGRIAGIAGTRSAASGGVRGTTVPGSVAPSALSIGTIGSNTLWFSTWYQSTTQGGGAFGGAFSAGAAPPVAAPASQLVPSGQFGVAQTAVGADSRGNLTALIARTATGSPQPYVAIATRGVSAAAWSAPVTLPVQLAPVSQRNAQGTGVIPLSLSVDSAGNALAAFPVYLSTTGTPLPADSLAPPGTPTAVAVVQRVGTAGAWGTPQVVQATPSGQALLAIASAVGSGVVSVSALMGSASQFGPWTVYAASGAPGQPLPSPTALLSPRASLEQLNGFGASVSMQSAVNAQGTVATVFGGAMSNGQTDGLWAVTAPRGGAWSKPVEIARCRNASGGYGGMDLAAYSSGFIASWTCLDSTNSSAAPRIMGTATYR
jgi:hypothetical protein